jgi:hypothetical protein
VNPVIVISADDNVGTALEPLEAGRSIALNGTSIVIGAPIPRGHKVALARIRAGQPVIKYGSSIGVATADIAPGAHVHTHNLASERGRGDLAASTPLQDGRIAEPPDDRRNG